VKAMEFIDTHDVSEALEALNEHGEDATVLAGGTDVVVQMLAGDIRPPVLVHIRPLAELGGITPNDRTEIGALTTHWELGTSSTIHGHHRALAEAALTVGGRQTQNVGTIAGNVVNASPAADLLPALLVGNAQVAAASSSGRRSLPLDEFLVDRKRTALAPNELVASVSLELPGPRTGQTYLKVGRRGAMEVAVVGLAALVQLGEGDAIAEARIALCSVGPKAFRVREAEAVLIGTRAEEVAVAEAGSLLQGAARPIDDVRSTARYRSRILPALLASAVSTCVDRARS
jgi:aerobic carbon-monoxide dehydrogenase medium subunit